jgi:hypothetical protein
VHTLRQICARCHCISRQTSTPAKWFYFGLGGIAVLLLQELLRQGGAS